MGDIAFHFDKEDFILKIQSKSNDMSERMTNLLDDSSKAILVLQKNAAPIRYGDANAGLLRGSHIIEPTGEFERWIGPDVGVAPHAPFVIKGTSPHIIEATNADALGPFSFSSYLGKSIGGYVKPTKTNMSRAGPLQFFKSVHHPGTAPNDYISETLPDAEDIVSEQIKDFLSWLTD